MKSCDECGCAPCECKKREELRKAYITVISDQLAGMSTFKLKSALETIESL